MLYQGCGFGFIATESGSLSGYTTYIDMHSIDVFHVEIGVFLVTVNSLITPCPCNMGM